MRRPGRDSFERLRSALARGGSHAAFLYGFDLLELDRGRTTLDIEMNHRDLIRPMTAFLQVGQRQDRHSAVDDGRIVGDADDFKRLAEDHDFVVELFAEFIGDYFESRPQPVRRKTNLGLFESSVALEPPRRVRIAHDFADLVVQQ